MSDDHLIYTYGKNYCPYCGNYTVDFDLNGDSFRVDEYSENYSCGCYSCGRYFDTEVTEKAEYFQDSKGVCYKSPEEWLCTCGRHYSSRKEEEWNEDDDWYTDVYCSHCNRTERLFFVMRFKEVKFFTEDGKPIVKDGPVKKKAPAKRAKPKVKAAKPKAVKNTVAKKKPSKRKV